MKQRRAPTRAELEYRFRRHQTMAPWYGRTMVTLASTFPTGVTVWLLQAFAGETTELNVTLVTSISVVANVAMAAALRRRRLAMDEQSKELNRLRGRVEELVAASTTLAGSSRQRGARR